MRELSVGSRGLEYAGGGNLNSDWVEVDDNGLLCLRNFSIDYPLGAVAESVGREVDSCKPSSVLAERMLARPRCHCISGRFFLQRPQPHSATVLFGLTRPPITTKALVTDVKCFMPS